MTQYEKYTLEKRKSFLSKKLSDEFLKNKSDRHNRSVKEFQQSINFINQTLKTN